MTTAAPTAPCRIIEAPGPRAAEEALLEIVAQECASIRAEPSRLARPFVILVPSRSLREHVLARLTQAFGAVAGIEVMSLRAAANGVVRRAGAAAPDGRSLLPVLARRAAEAEEALRGALDGLEDGYAAVTPTVNDLLDAGLLPAHLDAALEQIAEGGASHAARRAGAVFRTAVEASRALERHGCVHRAALFRRAVEAVQADEAHWPARATWIHGYADATGTQADLLEALLRVSGGGWVLDVPPNPAVPDAVDAGVAFLGRLQRRAASFQAAVSAPAVAPATIALFRAPGVQAEVREVAERAATLIDDGVAPERIGVVARDLAPYTPAIRAQFARVGVPYSGAPGSPGAVLPAGRRIRGLRSLLHEGAAATVDRWLAVDASQPASLRHDLSLAFHVLGRARLADAAALVPADVLDAAGRFPLPVREGLIEADDEGVGLVAPRRDFVAPRRGFVAPRRGIDGEGFESAVARLGGIHACLVGWPEHATLGEHVARLQDLVFEDLSWPAGSGAGAELAVRLEALLTEVEPSFALSGEEWRVLLDRALADAGVDRLGGAGGGVAVLGAVEARARTFEHLFLVGVNRDRFPLAVPEDPLLPDALRTALEWGVLPDIPIKRRGFDEERYLFAQLCSAAPRVTVSWISVSDDGKEKAPSPFAERLRLAAEEEAVPRAAEWLHDRPGPLPADEAATLAGLEGDAVLQRDLLAIAFAGRAPAPAAVAAADWAAGRVAVTRELDRGGRDGDLGPYLGLIGDGVLGGDAPVTHLEGVARCGWQAFLSRGLRLEPLPDATTLLPDLSPLRVGNLLHRFLERVAAEAGVPVGAHLPLSGGGRDVAWPAPDALVRDLEREAAQLLADDGIHLPGLVRVLAGRTAALLQRIREVDWPDGTAHGVLAVEAEGRVEVPGPEGSGWTVSFRADRVDVGPVLTDYKSGKSRSEAAGAETRARHLLQATRTGELLQLAVYLLGAGPTAAARYLAAGSEARFAALESADAGDELRAVGARTLAVLLAARDAGAFVPRLAEQDGGTPQVCGSCDFRDACRQHDTGARHRLLDWVAHPGGAPVPGETAARAVRALADATAEDAR